MVKSLRVVSAVDMGFYKVTYHHVCVGQELSTYTYEGSCSEKVDNQLGISFIKELSNRTGGMASLVRSIGWIYSH